MDEIRSIPVHKEDFEKINEFAEAAWICRQPEKTNDIKAIRRELLEKVGTEIIRIISLFSKNVSEQCFIAEEEKEKEPMIFKPHLFESFDIVITEE